MSSSLLRLANCPLCHQSRGPEVLAKAVEETKTLDEGAFRGGFILEKMMGPLPKGHMELRTRDPNDNTSVTFNYFNTTLKNNKDAFEDTVTTIWHYHGGCQVGKVVDSDYKVLGVDALRVVDGSTFIDSPGTNPQATVKMLGRYMGVKILNARFAANK